MMIYAAALVAILVTILLGIARAILGPTVYDRIAAMNVVGTKTILLIAVFAFFTGRHDLLDIALVYALINFIGIIAVLKLVEQGNLFTDGESIPDSSCKETES